MKPVHLMIRYINICLLIYTVYLWYSGVYKTQSIRQNAIDDNVEFFNVEKDTPLLGTSVDGELTAIQIDEKNILKRSDMDIHAVDVPGMIHIWASASVPKGWLLCNGSVCDRTNPVYERLFEAIGYTYGGSGDFFNLPNLQGRFPLGVSSTKPLGRTGGEERVTLQETHLPRHKHSFTANGEHSHGYQVPYYKGKTGSKEGMAGGGYNSYGEGTGWAGNHTHTMGSVGGNGSHENMPPYRVINFIIKL